MVLGAIVASIMLVIAAGAHAYHICSDTGQMSDMTPGEIGILYLGFPCFGGLFGPFAYIGARRRHWRVDQHGIEVHVGRKTRHCTWGQITSVTIKPFGIFVRTDIKPESIHFRRPSDMRRFRALCERAGREVKP